MHTHKNLSLNPSQKHLLGRKKSTQSKNSFRSLKSSKEDKTVHPANQSNKYTYKHRNCINMTVNIKIRFYQIICSCKAVTDTHWRGQQAHLRTAAEREGPTQ